VSAGPRRLRQAALARRAVRLPPAWALLLLAGCGAEPGPELELAEEIAVQRAVWEAGRPARYRMILRHLCFCPPAAVGPVEVVVDGDTVTRRTYWTSGEAVDPSLADAFPTVAGLFDLLEGAVAGGADEVEVEWDPDTGAPRDLFIDYDTGVADEERGYRLDAGPDPLPR
jgi:hypothetical protein